MRYETLQLSCECGQHTTRIREVGFTADHQLVLHWRCLACKKYVYVVKSLSDCWRDCPQQEEAKGEIPSEENLRESDLRFLRSLGVTLPDTVEP
ncbi:MAG TPA: hypothetical protein VKT49_19595 [Bryobacteraceae bacterium]|nr:hypothetical protein [Bryobacteraceae bacterium]